MHCQKCRSPLKLDGSLEDLNPAAFDLLVAASSQAPFKKNVASRPAYPQDGQRKSLYDQVSKATGSPAVFKRHGGSGGAHPSQRDSAMSFIFLTQSQVGGSATGPPAASRKPRTKDDGSDGETARPVEMERLARLYEILSSRSDIDHPICIECTEMLVDGLQKKLEATTRERDAYVGYLKQIQSDQPSKEDVEAEEEALKEARQHEADAMEELVRLEREKAAMDEEMAALEEESRQLDAEEEGFWRERNDFAAKLSDFQNERDSINSKFDHDSQLLEKLRRSNVYNDTFCISHDGTFATINGLRLGRLSSRPVDWPEINAAWGHALLLLVTVAEKLGYVFSGFEPQPMGSTSKIVRLDVPSPSSSRVGSNSHQRGPPPAPKRTALELYSSGDTPLGLTFMHRKLNLAMVAFLELVRQLGAHVERETGSAASGGGGGAARATPLKLPYKIDGDKIGDVSVKLGMAQDESWTKACKLTLTCCKFLLAHASNMSTRRNDTS